MRQFNPERHLRRVTNVRDDKVLTSKFWRPSFEVRRCIVPASSYCEPSTCVRISPNFHAVVLSGKLSAAN